MTSKRQRKQLFLPGFERVEKTEKTGSKDSKASGTSSNSQHGGEHAKGKRKGQRPFDPKQALHVVLRSSRARGELSMLNRKHCNHIFALKERLKKRWGISVYRYANVGNHIHLLIRSKKRADWQGFIREFSGGVAMIVTGAKKGNGLNRSSKDRSVPESAKRGFWDGLVFTRMVSWGKDFKNTAGYVLKNLWEAFGVPVRKLSAKGYLIQELAEDGVLLVHRDNPSDIEGALAPL